MRKFLLFLVFLSAQGQALQQIDDSRLSTVHGQSGVTIEFETNNTVTIDQFLYIDNDGVDGTAASFSLDDIAIASGTSSTVEIDVTSAGRLDIQLKDIQQGDLSISSVNFSDRKIGSIEVNDINFDPAGSYRIGFASISTLKPDGTPVDRGALIFNLDFKNSSFVTKWTQDDYSMSQKIQYKDFYVADVSISLEDRDEGDGLGSRAWARMDVSGITGDMRIEDITLGPLPVAAQAIGTVGFGGLNVDPNSYISITGH